MILLLENSQKVPYFSLENLPNVLSSYFHCRQAFVTARRIQCFPGVLYFNFVPIIGLSFSKDDLNNMCVKTNTFGKRYMSHLHLLF